MRPLVSILIPAYNAERWVADTIRSALLQTWPSKEIVIVDDGSSDQTLAIARQFESRSLKVLTQQNSGAAAARNRAFAECQGDYIQWLDADDLLASDKIAKQLELLKDAGTRTLLSSSWGQFLYRPNRAKFTPTPLWCDLNPIEWLVLNLEKNYWMQTSSWLVSRELTRAAGPWDTRLLGDDDGEYFCRVIVQSDRIRFAPESRVFYRRSPNSLSYLGRSRKKLEAHFLALQLRIGHVRSLEDSERLRTASASILIENMCLFYPEHPDIVEEIQRLLHSLGAGFEVPRLPWKYAWIQKLFGWSVAKRVQLHYNQCKSWLIGFWDKALFRLERHSSYQ